MEKVFFGVIILVLILIVSVIQLTADGIMIVKYHHYEEVLRLHIDLYIYNMAIGCIGILVSGSGLFAVLGCHRILGKSREICLCRKHYDSS